MFNLGGGEIIMIALVALLVIKPEKIPGFATGLGRFIAQIRNQVLDVKTGIEKGFNDESTHDDSNTTNK